MAEALDGNGVQEHIRALARFGSLPDDGIDIADAALQMAALLHPGLVIERYRNHIKKLAQEVGERHAALEKQGAGDSLDSRITALRGVLAQDCGYTGDADPRGGNFQDADLIAVIDRRMGCAPALAVLYLHAARAQGWEAHGLDIPGGFAVRLDMDGERTICDPSASLRVLQAPDLRRTVKRALGKKAELLAGYYEPASNRAALIKLQNVIKTRQIEAEDYEGALCSVQAMRAVDPGEYRLLFDEGVLAARLGETRQAVAALEQYIERAPKSRTRDRHEAAALLQQLKATL